MPVACFRYIAAGLLVSCGFVVPIFAQLRLADIQPGMAQSTVLAGLSKEYTRDMGYRVDSDAKGTSIIRWISENGKEYPGSEVGLVLYENGRVSVVEEFYNQESMRDSPELVRALIGDLRSHVKQPAPFAGHPARFVATARIVLDEIEDPEKGETESMLQIMFGNTGTTLTLTTWNNSNVYDSYVTLTRRREAPSR